MGIKVQTPDQYAASFQKFFPRGPYWDRQFADSKSDCVLFCEAKPDEFVRFRNRMSDLQNESAIQSAAETIEDWERVLTGSVAAGLTVEQRRALLFTAKTGNISTSAIKAFGQMYGLTITNIEFPFRSAFFGFSRFALDQITSPASFSVLFIYVDGGDETNLGLFKSQIANQLLANYIVYYILGGL
ncbi:MAG: YmfQ family protein [Treponema sp.]|jgi:uncharacterized protein YmfQ (DUF2313 family)|nr:YmfQ family protein [Treponema sp.]